MVLIEEVVETPPPSPPPSPPPTPVLPKSTASKQNDGLYNKRRYGSHEWSEEIAMSCDNCRSPFVLWAQDADHILLKVWFSPPFRGMFVMEPLTDAMWMWVFGVLNS